MMGEFHRTGRGVTMDNKKAFKYGADIDCSEPLLSPAGHTKQKSRES